MILRGSIHIKDLATAHYVRIRINRINRIRDENNICIFKKIRDIATVTFGPITDKKYPSYPASHHDGHNTFEWLHAGTHNLVPGHSREMFPYA